MNDLQSPERLLVSAKPGSALERGLITAQSRTPDGEQLRALEMSLAAALGGVAMGTVTSSAATGANGAGTAVGTSGLGSAMPAVLWAGSLKVTLLVTIAITTAAVCGLVARRHAVKEVAQPRGTTTVSRTSDSGGPSTMTATGVVPFALVPAAGPVGPSPSPGSLPAFDEDLPPSTSPGSLSPGRPERGRPTREVPRAGVRTAGDGLTVIKRAQRALAHDPAFALALVEAHRRRFPGSPFAQEDEVIAVEALSKLGRVAEARDRAAAFVGRYPDSVHTLRMRRAAAPLVP